MKTQKKAVATPVPVQVQTPDGATPLTVPAGKMALLRSNDYRNTLQPTTTSIGNKSFDNGDSVALLLRGADLETVYKVGAKELGVTVADLKAKYGHLNPGQQRMNVGNRVRGAVKKREAKLQQSA